MSEKTQNPVAYTRHDVIAVLRINNPPVNALSLAVRKGLWEAMDRAEADAGVKAVLIVGEGRAFIAGADITEFGKPPMEPWLPDLCLRIEQSPLLVVASLHGVSLGGGLEIALSAHYRIAQPDAHRVARSTPWFVARCRRHAALAAFGRGQDRAGCDHNRASGWRC
jgi:enoyl-CoA hydratase/carnithine racemase